MFLPDYILRSLEAKAVCDAKLDLFLWYRMAERGSPVCNVGVRRAWKSLFYRTKGFWSVIWFIPVSHALAHSVDEDNRAIIEFALHGCRLRRHCDSDDPVAFFIYQEKTSEQQSLNHGETWVRAELHLQSSLVAWWSSISNGFVNVIVRTRYRWLLPMLSTENTILFSFARLASIGVSEMR